MQKIKSKQQFYWLRMQTLGAGNRRKSYAHAEPTLPRHPLSRESGTRTVYKQLPNLSEQLRNYRRKLVFDSMQSMTNREAEGINLPTYRSLNFKKSNQTLVTMGSETDAKLQKSTEQSKNELPSCRIQDQQQQPNQQQIRLNIDDDNPNDQNQLQNENVNMEEQIQGYTMGNQAQAEEEQDEDKNKMVPKLKSYATVQQHQRNKLVNFYQPLSQAESRMQLKYLQGKFQLLRARREDNQIISMINQYKVNKKAILKQSDRKMQSMKALASIRRASSLPKLSAPAPQPNDKAQQIIVPSFEELVNPDGNPEEYKRKLLAKRLENSMSFGRLQVNNEHKKNKDINYEAHLQEELGYLLQTERILRSKGVKISTNSLKNSLLNLRQVPAETEGQFPKASLISNPFHPKQASKKKKK